MDRYTYIVEIAMTLEAEDEEAAKNKMKDIIESTEGFEDWEHYHLESVETSRKLQK